MCLHMNPYLSFYFYLSFSLICSYFPLYFSLPHSISLWEESIGKTLKEMRSDPLRLAPLRSHTQNHNDSSCRPAHTGCECVCIHACAAGYICVHLCLRITLLPGWVYMCRCVTLTFFFFWHFTTRQTQPSNELRLEIKSTACTHLAKAF